jgi:hypothetical protein
MEVKGKVLPVRGHEGPEGEYRYSLTSALEGGVWSTPRPGRFTPWKKKPVPTEQKAGWFPRPFWTGTENLAHTGVKTPDRPAHSEPLNRLRYPGKHREEWKYISTNS